MLKMRNLSWACMSGAILMLSVLPGCGSNPPEKESVKSTETHSKGDEQHHEGDGHDHSEDGHDHPSEGPHHGHLVELGNEEYHAELVHDDDAGTVTIYLLDGSAKKAVPIDAAELMVNLKHDGKGEQFKIAAAPDEGDPNGKSSRFISDDPELGEDLDREGVEATLVVKISGKSYRGDMSHDHDDHGHGGHEKDGDHDH